MHILHLLLPLFFRPLAVSSAIIPPTNSLSPLNTRPNPLANPWTPQCHRINNPGMTGLNPTNCVLASDILCQYLRPRPIHPSEYPREKWIWVEQPGCAVAFYRPAVVYYEFRSCNRVFSVLIDTCAHNSRFNAGSMNVLILPDFRQDGRAKDDMRNMYLLAPERLTL
ncbi:MAG: hypothetical protein LQ349_006322 [Xanthoria aureola]|nr:MAG: hypothetical protein LQ349_006322 [Xanthoria aureola]